MGPVFPVFLAHYLADVPDDCQAELGWVERALVADERAQAYHESRHVSRRVHAFPPSHYLNLADDHRRLGNAARAREYLELARDSADALGDDDYGVLIKRAITAGKKAIREGSTASLPTS